MATRNATRKAVKPQVTSEANWLYTVYCPECQSDTRSKVRRSRCLTCRCDEVTCRMYQAPVKAPRTTQPRSYCPSFIPHQKVWYIEGHRIVEACVIHLDYKEGDLVGLYAAGESTPGYRCCPNLAKSDIFKTLEDAQKALEAKLEAAPAAVTTILSRPFTFGWKELAGRGTDIFSDTKDIAAGNS